MPGYEVNAFRFRLFFFHKEKCAIFIFKALNFSKLGSLFSNLTHRFGNFNYNGFDWNAGIAVKLK